MNAIYYIEHHWGTYNDLVQLSMRDLIEIRIGIESKKQEEQIQEAFNI